MTNYPIHIWTPDRQNEFSLPRELFEIISPPQALFIQGAPDSLKLLQQLPERGLAIVGTRNPQLRSLRWVQKIVSEIPNTPESSLIIISGFARGVDTVAHQTAIRTGKKTIAILGAGLEINYPQENERLRSQILESGGLLVSEYPPKTPARNYHFLERNRIIASWARATWVVEAGLRSGALNTAKWAREHQRLCFALPCFPGDATFAGNQVLLDRDHAIPLWNTHSLGVAWLNLSTVPQLSLDEIYDPEKSPLATLTKTVQQRTFQSGGINLQSLYNWATQLGWSPQLFFSTLDQAVQEKRVVNHPGGIISS